MLYKKELSIIPLCVMRSATVQIKHSVRFFGSAQIVELKRSGIVLNVDFFDLDGNVVWRFFSDGNTHISMNLYRGSGWSRGTVNGHLGTDRWSEHYFTSPDDELLAGGFLGQLSTYSDNRIANMCDGFIYDKYSKSAHRSWEKWVAPMQKHFKLFTYPKGMERYCDTYVFKKYLFYKKAGRKEYEVECSYCGHRYTSAQTPKHKHEGKCHKCRCQALYFRRQYITSIYEKDELCVARKHGNLTLISWVTLYRDFRGGSPAYQYYDRFRNVVEADEGKKTVYAYFMREGRGYYGYYNHGWFRMKNGEIGSSDAYIYKPGAKYLVPALWEGFDLVEHLRNPRQRTNLEALLYNLKQYPQTEYLLKMGLHEFVNGWGLGHFICGGKGFGGALGIRPQYLPLYKAYKPTRREHELIRKSEQWISEELFLKIRAHPEITYEKLEKALEYTSLEKLVNYLFKQYEHYAQSIKCFGFTQLLTWFRDYFDMARKVNIDLSRKSRLMPRDLKFSHDRLSVRISEARRRQKEEEDVRIEALRDEERQKAEQERLEKQERNREAFQVVKERIYTKIPQYRNSEYIVVLPQCEEDFIAEGDSLGHCVGNGTYYSNHVKMNTMVFFIRRANRPDRPYITLSVNMSSCTKGELYGYGDHAVTTAVKDFVNGFLKAMKQSLKIKDPPPEKKKQVVTHREDRVVNMPRAA